MSVNGFSGNTSTRPSPPQNPRQLIHVFHAVHKDCTHAYFQGKGQVYVVTVADRNAGFSGTGGEFSEFQKRRFVGFCAHAGVHAYEDGETFPYPQGRQGFPVHENRIVRNHSQSVRSGQFLQRFTQTLVLPDKIPWFVTFFPPADIFFHVDTVVHKNI